VFCYCLFALRYICFDIVVAQHTNLPLCSPFNLPNGPVRGIPPFSLPQTGPAQCQSSGPFWNSEGEQNFHQDPISPHGSAQSGFAEPLNSFHVPQEAQSGQNHGRGSFSGSSRAPWNTELSSTEMSRQLSTDSTGAHSQGTTYSSAVYKYDQIRSSSIYLNGSHVSYHAPSVRSDGSDRSNSPVDFYDPTHQDLQEFEIYSYQNGEDFAGPNPMLQRNSMVDGTPAHIPMASGPAYHPFAPEDEMFSLTPVSSSLPSQVPVSRDSLSFPPSAIMNSHDLWDSAADLLDSQRSSPTLLEDPWTLPPSQMMTSTTNSPMEYSPSLDGLSPRYVQDVDFDLVEQPPYTTTGDRATRKPGPRQSKVTSDLAAASRRPRLPGTSETSDESFKLVGRSSLDLDNSAREHPLYHNVTPKADGLYHCPFEDDPKANCAHKPEKLKCNYEYDPVFLPSPTSTLTTQCVTSKFVDSHLKPYKCKVGTCKDLCFSSTACLLRHEREAHAMHGHGDKPYLCTYEGCERGVPGNGFPRHWNLRDHMKRVHNDPGTQPKSNASGSPPASGGPASKSKKRKASEVANDAPFMEKPQKRNATPPAVTCQPQEPSLVDRYQEKQQMLREVVAKLEDPRNTENMALLRNANDCIKVMVQTTQRIVSAPVGQNFNQQSG